MDDLTQEHLAEEGEDHREAINRFYSGCLIAEGEDASLSCKCR